VDLAPMTENQVPTVRIVGGGAIPTSLGWFTATSPFAVLTADNNIVAVDLQPKWIKRMMRVLLRRYWEPTSGEALWSAPWSEVTEIEIGPMSVFISAQASRGCRFVAFTPEKFVSFLRAAADRGISVKEVRTTLPRYYR
jgi:hypothetical protein